MGQILGALFAAFVGIASIGVFVKYQDQSNENIRTSGLAQQAKLFNEGAKTYIRENVTTIQATATDTVPAVITPAMMRAVNALPPTFPDTNAYGQTWVLQVLEPTAGNLQALAFTTGGEAMPDKPLGKAASLVGADGGLIPINNSGLYAGGPANAYGAFNGWTIPTANYTSVAGGHIASLLQFNNGQLTDNRLYRNAVPGQPQLNTMNTPIIMASVQTVGNACTDSGAIAADADGAVLSCQSGTWQPQGSAFWKDPVAAFAALPTCNASSAWQTRVVQTPSVGTGPRAYTCNGATWQALAVDDGGDITIADRVTFGSGQISGLVTEFAACSPAGSISKVSDGALVSCEDGTWKRPGYSHWKGHYMTLTGACWVGNPFTGGCSCPAGYSGAISFAIQVGGCNPCYSFNCYRG